MVTCRHGLHGVHALKGVIHVTAAGHVREHAQTPRLLLMGRSVQNIRLRTAFVLSSALVSDLSSSHYEHSSVFQTVKTSIINQASNAKDYYFSCIYLLKVNLLFCYKHAFFPFKYNPILFQRSTTTEKILRSWRALMSSRREL